MSGRWTSALAPTRRRQAPEIYWQLRTAAESVRLWLTSYYTGSRTTQEWTDLWVAAESIDLTLQKAWQEAERATPGMGYQAVCYALGNDDRLESWCCRISAQITYLRTGEQEMLHQLQASRPPGSADLAPDWAVGGARDNARALFQQAGRARGGPAAMRYNMDDEDAAAPRTPRRRRRAVAGTASAPAASSGGGGARGAQATAKPKGPPKAGGGGGADPRTRATVGMLATVASRN